MKNVFKISWIFWKMFSICLEFLKNVFKMPWIFWKMSNNFVWLYIFWYLQKYQNVTFVSRIARLFSLTPYRTVLRCPRDKACVPLEPPSPDYMWDLLGQAALNFPWSRRCKFTTDAHHSPKLVKGNCPLSLLVRWVTTRRLYRNQAIQRCCTGIPVSLRRLCITFKH